MSETEGSAAPSGPLDQLIGALQRRWGLRALQRGPLAGVLPRPLATGIPLLDTLLDGGLPRGATVDLLGRPTSGATTIALQTLAHAQAQRHLAAFIDLPGRFHAPYAAACGVDLSALLLVSPTTAHEGIDLIDALLDLPVDVLIVPALAALQLTDDGHRLLAMALPRWQRMLARGSTVLLTVTYLPYPPALAARLAGQGSSMARAAALRLHVERHAWSFADPLIPQCYARVTVLRRRNVAAGATCDLTLALPLGDREDV